MSYDKIAELRARMRQNAPVSQQPYPQQEPYTPALPAYPAAYQQPPPPMYPSGGYAGSPWPYAANATAAYAGAHVVGGFPVVQRRPVPPAASSAVASASASASARRLREVRQRSQKLRKDLRAARLREQRNTMVDQQDELVHRVQLRMAMHQQGSATQGGDGLGVVEGRLFERLLEQGDQLTKVVERLDRMSGPGGGGGSSSPTGRQGRGQGGSGGPGGNLRSSGGGGWGGNQAGAMSEDEPKVRWDASAASEREAGGEASEERVQWDPSAGPEPPQHPSSPGQAGGGGYGRGGANIKRSTNKGTSGQSGHVPDPAAVENWTLEDLMSADVEHMFKVGEDDGLPLDGATDADKNTSLWKANLSKSRRTAKFSRLKPHFRHRYGQNGRADRHATDCDCRCEGHPQKEDVLKGKALFRAVVWHCVFIFRRQITILSASAKTIKEKRGTTIFQLKALCKQQSSEAAVTANTCLVSVYKHQPPTVVLSWCCHNPVISAALAASSASYFVS